MNQKELARLQVLNNVLEHRLPMDQAAELMGVTERTLGAFWRRIARREPPLWPTATGDVSHLTLSQMSWLRLSLT